MQIPAIKERADFVEKSFGQHLFKPNADALMQPCTILGLQANDMQTPSSGLPSAAGSALGNQRCHALTGMPIKLKRTGNTLRIIGV
jgi:hypothetical protein